jgi:hypothetical protein
MRISPDYKCGSLAYYHLRNRSAWKTGRNDINKLSSEPGMRYTKELLAMKIYKRTCEE